ncbi:acyl-CoA dehydrogenase family protein [Roseivivax sp. CAU 1761]
MSGESPAPAAAGSAGVEAEEATLLDRIAAFAAAEVAPAAPRWSKGEAPEAALQHRAAELGLTRLCVPRAAGGLGLRFRVQARACALLAAADFGFAMSLVNTHNAARRIAESAPAPLAAAHLPALLWGQTAACTALTEPAAGSDAGALEMRAVRSSDGWLLDGEKVWIVNARNAALAIVYAQCGQPGDRNGIAAFLVDLTAPGCRRRALGSDFAQASAGTGGFVLSGVAVPAEAMLLPPGTAFRAILDELNGARAYVAAMCCGMLRAALDRAAGYGATRHSFGRPLAGHQAWRLALARAATDLAAAEALTDRAVAAVETGAEARLLAAQAKLSAVAAAQTHLPALLHAMGAEGLRPEHPMARHLGAAQIAALVDGSTEMLLEQVARATQPHRQTG